MKIVVINQKVAFARHWGKWYRVLRAGEDWRPLPIGQQYQKPFNLKKTARGLEKAFGKPKLPKEVEEIDKPKRAV